MCEQCDEKRLDVVLKVSHTVKDVPECPQCHAPMTKQYGTFNAHFKGSGFHATDYRAPTRGF